VTSLASEVREASEVNGSKTARNGSETANFFLMMMMN